MALLTTTVKIPIYHEVKIVGGWNVYCESILFQAALSQSSTIWSCTVLITNAVLSAELRSLVTGIKSCKHRLQFS